MTVLLVVIFVGIWAVSPWLGNGGHSFTPPVEQGRLSKLIRADSGEIDFMEEKVVAPEELKRFEQWARRYVLKPDSESIDWGEGLSLAQARRAVMLRLIQEDPRAALAAALPRSLWEQLPDEIREQVEEPFATTAFYGVAAICHHGSEEGHNAQCRIERQVVLGFGTFDSKVLQASVYGSRQERLTEENASLFGVRLDGWVALHEDDRVVLPAEDWTSDPQYAGQLALIEHGQARYFPDEESLRLFLNQGGGQMSGPKP